MKLRPSRTRAAAAALLTVAAMLAVSVPSASALTPVNQTIYIKDGKAGLRFVAPDPIESGRDLTIVNQTNPRQVGPHTFSLVTKGSLPKTPKARQLCFTPKRICQAIAAWHGVKGNGPVSKNPAKAGLAGWDTEGSSAADKGDSWFTGNKAGTSITQEVSVDTTAGPVRIHFLCAIHPWMQGSVQVVPPLAPQVPTAG